MRHSKRKSDHASLPEQDATRSPDDYAPGGAGSSQGDGQTDTSFDELSDTQGGMAAPSSMSDVEDSTGAEQGTDSDSGASATRTDRNDSELAVERDKYLRLAAEYDNYRKRSAKERQDAGARAQADLVRQLVDALDDVARFAHVDPATTDAGTVVQGVDMVEKKLMKALGGAGLEVINPIGETFDPALHEAVATEPTSAREDDHVVSRVYQPGYLFKSQLLRPARVVVKQWNG
ncbi:MAG: nucleotide exchange factor GrpE [Gemmatimonadaceae bacterium]